MIGCKISILFVIHLYPCVASADFTPTFEIIHLRGTRLEARLFTHTSDQFLKPGSIMPSPRRIAVDDLTANHIGTFKKLHQVLFPIEIAPSFYKDALNASVTLSKLGYYNDIPVACFSAKIYPEKAGPRIYLLTFGVLAPYRRLGLGAKMLDYLESHVKNELKAKSISLHVQEGNDAKEWYIKNGYTEEKFEENYYPKSQPSGAYFLTKSMK